MNRPVRREASTREKVIQVLLGLLMFVVFALIALGVLIYMVKAGHLGQGANG